MDMMCFYYDVFAYDTGDLFWIEIAIAMILNCETYHRIHRKHLFTQEIICNMGNRNFHRHSSIVSLSLPTP